MNCDSIPRAWHTASFIAGKNLLVIFGGERTVDGCPECLDDIMVLDTGGCLTVERWSLVPLLGVGFMSLSSGAAQLYLVFCHH